MTSVRSKWVVGGAIAAVGCIAVLGATRIVAQPPPGSPAVPGAPGLPGGPAAGTPGAPAAAPSQPSVRLPGDPAREITFAEAPKGPVKLVRKRSGGNVIDYYQFTSTTDRTYRVEIPVALTRDNRPRDAWITLFSAYGNDPQAEADVKAARGLPLTDEYTTWMNARIVDQIAKVTGAKADLAPAVQKLNLWSAIHRDAKTSNDMAQARAAWNVIANSKYDIKIALRVLAKEKLELGHLYKEAEQYQQARTQYEQTAQLNVWPYSPEAIAKLRVIEGATAVPALVSNPNIEGPRWMSQSDLYQAAQEALRTTP